MLPIGRTVGTETQPNTAYEFYFWAEASAKLGIGSMVKVEVSDSTVYGTVVQAYAYNDLPNALTDFLALQGAPGAEAPTKRPEIRFFQAAVLRRNPDEPVAAVGIGLVSEADAEDLRVALRGDKYEGGIPIGVYGHRENPMPVLADPKFILGPEAGHLNVTGTSGLAAKTSYIQFILQSIFQKLEGDDGVAAVLFNVKGGDLLFLEHGPKEPLHEDHLRIYGACGLEPKPFDKVRYYAPYATHSRGQLKTLRNHPDLMRENPTKGFCYGVEEILRHAEVLLNREDLDVKADAFLQYLAQEVAGRSEVRVGEERMPATNLNELVVAIEKMMVIAEGSQSGYKTHHTATIRKMLNRINGFATRLPGLISSDGGSEKPLPPRFEDRTLYVVDVAQASSDAQDLIFAAVISDLQDRMEKKQLGVKNLIVVVDELNKFAPSGGRETYVLTSLRDIAARGRYLGLVLFGAQQFRSRVDAQIVGNSANSAYGHILMEELSNPIYSAFSPAVREKMGAADPGEMMIRHPHFTQPVFIRFPIPSILKGGDGMTMFPHEGEKELRTEVLDLAQELGVAPAKADEVIGGWDPACLEEGLQKASRALSDAKRNGGGDALALLKASGRTRAQTARPAPAVDDPDDPFGIT